MNENGLALGSHTGSTSTRIPSISTSEAECPNHVTRRPLAGSVAYTLASVRNGPSGRFGSTCARLFTYCGSTLNTTRRPPTSVGTGFKNFPPCFSARFK